VAAKFIQTPVECKQGGFGLNNCSLFVLILLKAFAPNDVDIVSLPIYIAAGPLPPLVAPP